MATNNQVNVGLSGSTGTGNFVGANTPTLITPVLGSATATSVNFGGSTLNTYSALQTWTPVFTFATPGNLTVSYANQAGYYTRIGNIVTLFMNLSCTPTYTTSSGVVNITGLPFTANSNFNAVGMALSVDNNPFPAGTSYISSLLGGGTSIITFYASGSATSGGSLTTLNATTGVSFIMNVQITYLV